MRYRLRDTPGLLRTPIGREYFYARLSYFGWPLLAPVAGAYRRTLGRRTCVAAVVGSLGKTTAARALIVALGGRDRSRPNLNACSFVGLAVLRMRPGQPHAVIEVGIGLRGQMATYARVVRPDVVVVTSIASDHRPRLGTLEDTRDEKAAMVRALSAAGLAVLNGDDEHVRWMATQTRARVMTYGFGDHCDVRASDYALDWPRGSRFTLLVRGRQRAVRTRLLGRHQVYPILAAVAVALELGVDLDAALTRLAALAPSLHRLEPLRLANGAYLLRDEYKASQETYEAALDVLAEIPAERRLALLAEVDSLPDDEEPVYRALGERVARVADRVVIVAGAEASRAYAAGAQRAGMPPTALATAGTSWRKAADLLERDLRAGDVLLIKSGPFQRLDRVTLALAGRRVRCELVTCPATVISCDRCPMLERGWGSQPSGHDARPGTERQTIAHDAYALAVMALAALLSHGSARLREAAGALIGRLAYRVTPVKRALALAGVRAALGATVTPGRAATVVRGSYVTYWQDLLTLPVRRGADPGQIEMAGLEHLDRVLEQGRGVILWEHTSFGRRVLPKLLLARRGYRLHQVHAWDHTQGVGRGPLPDTWLYRRWIRPRLQAWEREVLDEVIAIPADGSLAYLKRVSERLRAGGIVCLAANGRMGCRFLAAEALGHPLALSSGAISLARATGAELLPMFCFRDAAGAFRLVIEPPLDVRRATPEAVVRRYAALLDEHVRRHPDQFHAWHCLEVFGHPGRARPPGSSV